MQRSALCPDGKFRAQRLLTNNAGVGSHGRHSAQHKHKDVGGGRQLGGERQGGHDDKQGVGLWAEREGGLGVLGQALR